MSVAAWVVVGLGLWLLLAVPAALAVGWLIRRGSVDVPAPPGATLAEIAARQASIGRGARWDVTAAQSRQVAGAVTRLPVAEDFQ